MQCWWVTGCVQYRNVLQTFLSLVTLPRLLRNVCKLFRHWTQPCLCHLTRTVSRHLCQMPSTYSIMQAIPENFLVKKFSGCVIYDPSLIIVRSNVYSVLWTDFPIAPARSFNIFTIFIRKTPLTQAYFDRCSMSTTVKPVFKTTREIGTTWELRTATSAPRPIQYTEMDLRNKATSEFRKVSHRPLGVPNSQVPLYCFNRILSSVKFYFKGTCIFMKSACQGSAQKDQRIQI